MPCYDYICVKCNNRFEAICNREIKDNMKCDKCGNVAERRITKAPASKINGYCYNNVYNPKQDDGVIK